METRDREGKMHDKDKDEEENAVLAADTLDACAQRLLDF